MLLWHLLLYRRTHDLAQIESDHRYHGNYHQQYHYTFSPISHPSMASIFVHHRLSTHQIFPEDHELNDCLWRLFVKKSSPSEASQDPCYSKVPPHTSTCSCQHAQEPVPL